MLILSNKNLHVSFCVVPGYKSFATQSRVIWILLNNYFTVSLWVVPWYDLTSTQCIRIQIFSSMILNAAPRDRFFGTQKTVIWIFHSMNPHVVLSLVCGCMVFEIHIPSINLISMNNMSLWYIFHVAFHVTFFTLFLVLQVFFYNPDCNNQNGIVWSSY